MKYLLDSDTLIRAQNDSYPYESCPAFWTWLERSNKEQSVFSIDKVRDELIGGGDHLSNWAKSRGAEFFLKTNGSETVRALREISNWVFLHEKFSEAAKRTFLSAADYRLIGHAIAMSASIVTFEKDEPDAIQRIKIPSVGKAFGVKCLDLWALRRIFPQKFVMQISN